MLVAVTTLVATVIGWMLLGPTATDDPAAIRNRIEGDARTLAALVEQYHREAHRYPDAVIWQLSADRGDARFFDPWRRAYLYRLEASTFSISSLGADREPGGGGTDMDVEMTFPRLQLDGDVAPKPGKEGRS